MLRLVSNNEILKEEERQRDLRTQAQQSTPLITGLAAFLRTRWNAAYDAKMPIQRKMLQASSQRNGEYDKAKLAMIRQHGGADVFMHITETKCRSGEGWLRDILLDSGDPPWDLKPTPKPELSADEQDVVKQMVAERLASMIQMTGQAGGLGEQESVRVIAEEEYRRRVMEVAHRRASLMKRRISDQFAQGGWNNAFNEFITDLVTFPSAFIKGPIVRRRRKLGWTVGVSGGTEVETTEELAPEYERVDPFRIYPEPGISHLNDGYIFHHHRMTSADLSELMGVPGYDSNAIAMLLASPSVVSWVQQAHELEKDEAERKFQTYTRQTDVYDALEFWGKIDGRTLVDWGLSPADVPEMERHYDANVWVVGDTVIKAVLNYDPLGEKPYAMTSFIKVAGAFWGKGIPELIEDIQSVCNASVRSLVDNMGISSGPQVGVATDRLADGAKLTELHPWQIHQFKSDPAGSSASPVTFFQPESNASELLGVYERFAKMADDHSGIPSYLSGDLDTMGAGRTASGLSMLMGAAGKGIRQVIMHIDNDIIKPIVQRQFIFNMRYDEDEGIKGDAEVVARGAVNLAVREQVNVRRIEFLNSVSQSEVLSSIVGRGGMAAIVRELAKSLQMPVDEVVPSKERMEMEDKIAAMQQQQQQALPLEGGGPASGGSLPAPTAGVDNGQMSNLVQPRGQ